MQRYPRYKAGSFCMDFINNFKRQTNHSSIKSDTDSVVFSGEGSQKKDTCRLYFKIHLSCNEVL